MERNDKQEAQAHVSQNDGEPTNVEQQPTPYRTIKDESKKAFLDRLIRNGWSDTAGTGTA